MAQLRQDYQKFVKRDAEVIAIGPEGKKPFSAWWQAHKMPFPGIPDPQHKIAELYGQQVQMFKLGRMPEVIVVDKQGNMRFRHLGNSMSDIPSNKEVLALLDEVNGEG